MRTNTNKARRGFTLIEFLIVTTLIAILASVAMPNYISTQKAANEASAIESMRVLISAEEMYRRTTSPPSYGFLNEMAVAGILRDDLGSGSKRGYTFVTFGRPDTSSFAFIAMPQGNSGNRWFYVDQTGSIRSRDGDVPDTGSPPLN